MSISSVHPLKHVAIIMDGNNRWAKKQGRKGIAGHRAGVERIRGILRACRQHGVEALTLFAFSSENWRRPPREVEALMSLFHSYLKREAQALSKESVKLKIIGSRERFSKRLLSAIEQAETIACEGEATLTLAVDYGGCWDISQACKQVIKQVQCGDLAVDDVQPEILSQHLSTSDLPPLDLLIRTGGEHRISNFLLWQAAYAELHFSDLLWPEFDERALERAVQDYFSRQRRFGKTGDQLDAETRNA